MSVIPAFIFSMAILIISIIGWAIADICDKHGAEKESEKEQPKITNEEMITVLHTLRMSSSRYEKQVIDAIIKRIGGKE